MYYSLSSSFLPAHFPGSSINVSSSHDHHQHAKTSHTIITITSKSTIPTFTKKQPLLTTIFKSIDTFISNFMDLPLTPSSDPTRVLSGNFAPVNELPPVACEVAEGSLPACLDGAYIRNGPNPQFTPRGRPYHLFDGDGMLHSVRISGGKAKLCSRYVKTYKHKQEGDRGYPFFESPFSSFNGRCATVLRCAMAVVKVITGYYNPLLFGFGTANKSLAYFCGSIFALCESDLPYEIRITSNGDITTLPRRDFRATGDVPYPRMTAHPKTDSITGEVYAFRCDILSPFLTFFKIDSQGKKGQDLPILSMKRTPCIHDFAITETYIIFQDMQIEVSPTEMITKGTTPVVYDHRKTPRIGILLRDAVDESRLLWIDAPGLNMLHVINAWEEDSGDKVVVVAPNFVSIECGFNAVNLIYSIVEKITVDVKAKKMVSREELCNVNLEFAVINPAYAGKKNKYVYAAVIDEIPKATGVVKLDVSRITVDCDGYTVGKRTYGAGCFGGEPYFVAREPHNLAAAEDDGYVVSYVHDEKNEESWFLVMNAKSTTLDIVAKVRLPGRVPYGFHGLFVAENASSSCHKINQYLSLRCK